MAAAPQVASLPAALLSPTCIALALPLVGYAGWKALPQVATQLRKTAGAGAASSTAMAVQGPAVPTDDDSGAAVVAISGDAAGSSQEWWKAAAVSLMAAVTLGSGMQPALAGPFTQSEINSLTYEQIKGTGLANTCPRVEDGTTTGKISVSGKRLENLCFEPTSFQVLEDRLTKNGVVTEAVNTKVTTRQTYVLTGIEGNLSTDGGKVKFTEKDGIDYAPTTVQMPGGERVPFLFTVKNLVANADTPDIAVNTKFAGDFKVPSYRTGLFLDPKGRGAVTGYDQAVALPALQAGGDDSLYNENNKKFDVGKGNVEFKVTSLNTELGEIGGVFVHQQPSDTDMGSKVPKTVLLKGSWFGTVQ
jgi:photosystem II oxygen-evolving enhancer protein 1